MLARRGPPVPRLKMPPVLPLVLPPAMKTSQMVPWSSAWVRGDHCIVSHGDAIAEDLCYHNPTQLQHCDDGHEDQEEVDSKASVDSFSCEDCVYVDAKDLEVNCHDAKEYEVDNDYAKVDDFSDAKENQTPAWDRGDRCIVSYGDALADEPCCDPPTQLDLDAAEYLWDGKYDFTTYEDKELAAETCYYNDEVEDYDHYTENCEDSDYDAEMGDWDSDAKDF